LICKSNAVTHRKCRPCSPTQPSKRLSKIISKFKIFVKSYRKKQIKLLCKRASSYIIRRHQETKIFIYNNSKEWLYLDYSWMVFALYIWEGSKITT
jgi:hypothetical protein